MFEIHQIEINEWLPLSAFQQGQITSTFELVSALTHESPFS